MSFLGAVASPVRQVLSGFAKSVQSPALIIGAGNFTVPSVLRTGGYGGEIRACDVTLYSCALGAFLGGWELQAWERPDCPEALRGLLRTDTPLDLAASVAMRVMLVWAGSTARLAAKAAKYQFRDEIDKYPVAPSKKETSTERLLDKRQRTFRWDRKTYRASSPTTATGPIAMADALGTLEGVIAELSANRPLAGNLNAQGEQNMPDAQMPDAGGGKTAATMLATFFKALAWIILVGVGLWVVTKAKGA